MHYRADWFEVAAAFTYDRNGDRVDGPVCAAGVAIADEFKIMVSTCQPERVYALIRWETLNLYLMRIGREDLADRWVSGYSDPRAPVPQKRRAALH